MKHLRSISEHLNEGITVKQALRNASDALTETPQGKKLDKSYIKDYLESLERMAKKDPKSFVKDYGDFTIIDYIEDVEYNMANESIVNEARASAVRLLKDVVKGSTSSVEGIKLSKDMAQAYLDWISGSTYGKKFGALPWNQLFDASFNWGIERYAKGKLKGELKELKAKSKEMSESVNEAKLTNRDANKVKDLFGKTSSLKSIENVVIHKDALMVSYTNYKERAKIIKAVSRLYKYDADGRSTNAPRAIGIAGYNWIAFVNESVNEDNGGESRMAKSDLFKIANYGQEIHDMLSDEMNLPEWVESKITKAADYLGSVKHYIDYEIKQGETFETVVVEGKGDKGSEASENRDKLKGYAEKINKAGDAANKAREAQAKAEDKKDPEAEAVARIQLQKANAQAVIAKSDARLFKYKLQKEKKKDEGTVTESFVEFLNESILKKG